MRPPLVESLCRSFTIEFIHDTTEPPSTTTAEAVDLRKEEVNIVTIHNYIHFKNLKFDFKYLLGSWSSLSGVFLS